MSSFKYMGLKDLFLLTKKKKDAKLHLHKNYHHKQSNDRHKQIQIWIIRAEQRTVAVHNCILNDL